MKTITFKNVVKNYGKTNVVDNLDLEIKKGERLVLLGPSGCGKSTTLRMIAGLEGITSGDLYFDDERVNDVTANNRKVAMVFQNYALYPHFTVWDNITFGLRMNKLPMDEIERRAKEAIKILNLEGLEKRFPKELSGGQRQRVALCRAVVKKSDFFLLDEPLSNLDVQLRNSSREELIKLHEIDRPTFVYVTHDQIEAMTIGHRIAILNQGKLQQIDTPEEVYKHPANTFVAKFIGTPPMNILTTYIKNKKLYLGNNCVLENLEAHPNIKDRTDLLLGIRPENINVLDKVDKNALTGIVKRIENYGSQKCLSIEINGENLKAVATDVSHITKFQEISFTFNSETFSLFDINTEKNINLEEKNA